MDNLIVTTKGLADIFGISVRQVQRLTLSGIIEPKSNERPYQYDLSIVCRQYCEHLTQTLHDNSENETIARLKEQKLQADIDLRTARAAVAKMEQSELEGKMHRAEDVEAITTDHVLFLRSLLMAMPGKLAVDLSGTHTAQEQAERVRQEVHSILNQLANYKYDPSKYKRRVRERNGSASINLLGDFVG